MALENLEVEERETRDHSHSATRTAAMASKSTSLVTKVIFGLLLIGLLAALIAVSVLLAEKTSDFDELSKKNTTVAAAATSGTTPSPTREPTYRLPKNVLPINYEIFLHIHLPFDEDDNITDAFTTKGSHVAITLKAVEDGVTSIVLHARTKGLTPSSGSVRFSLENVKLIKNETADDVEISALQFEDVDIVVLQLKSSLVREQPYILKIAFDGVIADDNQGLYRSSFYDGKKKWLATSQFQPYKARRAFPCFDEPGFRSTFSITLKYPERFNMVRSNGKATNPSTQGSWTTTKFSQTPPMPTYLVAFLVSDFNETTSLAKDIDGIREFPVSVIGVNDQISQRAGAFALNQGKQMITLMTKWYNQSYLDLLPKLDMVGVPDFNSGAMENWGLVLYRESSLMYRPSVSTADNKRGVAGIVGHELAHMIFGNLVTCGWWSDTWLNEGFARFMQYELMSETRPIWRLDQLFPYFVVREALRQDSYDTAHPLFEPNVKTLSQIDTMFDSVTYAKGASILRMIRGVMGKTNFDAAVISYVAENKLSNTKHQDLLENFDRKPNGNDMSLHMKEWIEKNGYPVLTLERDYSGSNDISYKQQRFLLPVGAAGSTTNASMDTIWHIPLTMTDGYPAGPLPNPDDLKKCWLTQKSGNVREACGVAFATTTENGSVNNTRNYLIANVQQYGFYRVNYDDRNWLRISEALASAASTSTLEGNPDDEGSSPAVRIDHIVRGQLIDDSFSLARAGNFGINYKIPLDLIGGYLWKETKYGPLASAMDSLRYIDQMLRDSADYSAMQNYMQKLMQKGLYQKTKWLNFWSDINDAADLQAEENDPERTYDKVMANNIIIENACYYETSSCLQDASDKFDQWKDSGVDFTDKFDSMENALKNTIVQSKHLFLCYGIRNGNKTHWDYLFDLYFKPQTTNSNKLSILRALACSRDPILLRRILEMTIDTTSIRAQDTNSVFSYLSRFYLGELLAWKFLQTEWFKLSRRSNIISDIAGNFKDEIQLNELRQLQIRVSGGKEIPEQATFDQTIGIIQANIWWMAQNKNITKLF